ncbi:MAG TPA: hypothetical protein VGH40_06030 [Roseiarcus sp.]|jgi:hypothetical protein
MTPSENPDPTEPGEGSRRGAVIGLLFVAALALVGYWIFQAMEHHNEIDNCIASGRRNCTGDLLHPDAPTP